MFFPTGDTQLGAPNYINVSARDGEEVTEVVCWGDRGMGGEVILVVQDTVDGGSFVQGLGTNIVVLWRRLDGSGTEPTDGAGKVGTTSEDFGKRGSE